MRILTMIIFVEKPVVLLISDTGRPHPGLSFQDEMKTRSICSNVAFSLWRSPKILEFGDRCYKVELRSGFNGPMALIDKAYSAICGEASTVSFSIAKSER
jgi:hypothetical protein